MSALATLQERTHVDQAVLFLRALQDDTEEAPWMVMGERQFWSASGFAHSLRNYASRRHLPWYVAAMLPIRFAWPDVEEKKQLAPDIFVAFTDQTVRSSVDADAEGAFPPFVVEVVSPSSESRDAIDKVRAYDLVQEYVLFRPEPGPHAVLSGYRRARSAPSSPGSRRVRTTSGATCSASPLSPRSVAGKPTPPMASRSSYPTSPRHCASKPRSAANAPRPNGSTRPPNAPRPNAGPRKQRPRSAACVLK